MFTAVAELLSILDLEQIEHNIFRGRSPQVGWQRVFGGQVIAQALVAAAAHRRGARAALAALLFHPARRPQRADHLRGRPHPRRQELHDAPGRGDPARPRDFLAAASFQIEEEGLDHALNMPKVTPPDDLPSEAELRERFGAMMPENVRRWFDQRAADRDAAGRPEALCRPRQADGPGPARLAPRYRQAARRPRHPSRRAGLSVGHDAARYRADRARPKSIFNARSRWRASTTRCGSTARSGPTSGCSMRRTARTRAARAGSPAASSIRRMGGSWPRSPRKV